MSSFLAEGNHMFHWDYIIYMSMMYGSVKLGYILKPIPPEGLKRIKDEKERKLAELNYYRNNASFLHAIVMLILSKIFFKPVPKLLIICCFTVKIQLDRWSSSSISLSDLVLVTIYSM